MKYHIQTTLIWDTFKKRDGCPISKIYRICSDRLVSQYLNEAVMESDYRTSVNRRGFCSYHLEDLYNGKNKLGLALQLSTRTDFLLENIKPFSNSKKTKKKIQKLKELTNTCVICDEVNDMMTRYSKTIAIMFFNDEKFRNEFKISSGFCFKHYILLLEHSSNSKKAEKEYIDALHRIMFNNLTKANNVTKKFCNSFDHKNTEKSDPKAIKEMVEKYL